MRIVEAQECPGPVTKAGEKWPAEQNRWSNRRWGSGPNEASIVRKGLLKPLRLNKIFWLGLDMHNIAWGFPQEGFIHRTDLAPWMAVLVTQNKSSDIKGKENTGLFKYYKTSF